MEQTFYLDSVDTVIFNQNNVNLIRLNKDIIWRSSNLSLFNFTGIDANGLYEGQIGYTNAVGYALGKYNYTYYRKIEPIPTTEEEVLGKYYKTYDSSYATVFYEITADNISSITLGTTEIFEPSGYENATDYVQEINVNNALNPESFNGFDFTTKYASKNDIPNLNISEIYIPSTYNGLPITEVLSQAFYGLTYDSGASKYSYYPTEQIKLIKLGSNIKKLNSSAFYRVCSFVGRDEGNDFILNNKLETINSLSLYGIYDGTYNFALPSSVKQISGEIFVQGAVSTNVQPRVNTFTVSSPSINIDGGTTYSSADQTKYLIFTKDVLSISGVVSKSTTSASSVVFEHPADAQITLSISSNKSATPINIYTDNEAVRAYDWATQNYTPTFYPLSDYTGG